MLRREFLKSAGMALVLPVLPVSEEEMPTLFINGTQIHGFDEGDDICQFNTAIKEFDLEITRHFRLTGKNLEAVPTR
ncbi:hypothetical protein KAR91_52055 [Candidatus Pacearchaeota archaeon]|nr:hypothetical protein [Candidatus Pacearchaeota archaeon]